MQSVLGRLATQCYVGRPGVDVNHLLSLRACDRHFRVPAFHRNARQITSRFVAERRERFTNQYVVVDQYGHRDSGRFALQVH